MGITCSYELGIQNFLHGYVAIFKLKNLIEETEHKFKIYRGHMIGIPEANLHTLLFSMY